MQTRIGNPALSAPGVLEALQHLDQVANQAADQAGLPKATRELVNPARQPDQWLCRLLGHAHPWSEEGR